MKTFTLPKTERLYLRDAIDRLFASGHGFIVYPYRVIYRTLSADEAATDPMGRVAIMTIAPKKKFKHAVDRNHVKRLTREAYRHLKLPLHEAVAARGEKMQVAFIYLDNKFLTYEETQARMQQIVTRLCEPRREHHQKP
jgi:ribonuclease P protein component